MTNIAKPSIDPANEGGLPGLFRHVFGKLMQDVNGMLPARVVAFNGDRNSPRVTVEPLVMIMTTENKTVARAQIASVPVFQFGAGGFLMSFPIAPNDLGWILASDRDISNFMQSFEASAPQTLRKNNFADSLFIPDVMRQYTINGEDSSNAVFQKADGSVRVALWAEFVKLTAPRGLGVNTQPDESLIFDMASTVKASRPWPRMTQAQRDAIPNPEEGFAVWNTTTHSLSTFNGITWS